MPVTLQCGLRTKRNTMLNLRKRKKKKGKTTVSSVGPVSPARRQKPLSCRAVSQSQTLTRSSKATRETNRSCAAPGEFSRDTGVKLAAEKVKNMYISCHFEDNYFAEAKGNSDNWCPTHSGDTLQFLCVTCDVMICQLCKMAEHQDHKARSLSCVAADAKPNLQGSLRRVTRYESDVMVALSETGLHRQHLQKVRHEIEDKIRGCHAQLQALIDAHRDSCLLELDAMVVGLDADACDVKDRLGLELRKVRGVKQKLHEAITGGNCVTLAKVNQELKDEWDENQLIQKSLNAIPGFLYTAKHIELDESQEDIDDFVSNEINIEHLIRRRYGRLVNAKRPLPAVGVAPKMAFRCSEEANVEVFSVCPAGNNKVAVSAGPPSQLDATTTGWTKSFFEDGRPSKSFEFGKCTLRREGDGRFVYLRHLTHRFFVCEDIITVFAKAEKRYAVLSLFLENECFIFRHSPLFFSIYKPDYIQRISSDFHVHPVAFDVCDGGNIFAILNEHDSADGGQIRDLFLCNDRKSPVSTYTTFICKSLNSVGKLFLSDVCFCTIQGREVLLVADALNHAIYMLRVELLSGEDCTTPSIKCEFERVLMDKCHLEHAPTALNKDRQGRLWVGCKGGYVFTVQLES